ncbi:MAG: glycosyltransferase family 4 protein [Flavobacterium sp.]|nr:MAG: glycosyltransferase family 4 protein [Flavobacterium sp.]
MHDHLNQSVVVLPSYYPMAFHPSFGNFFEEQTRLIKMQGIDVAVVFNETRSLSTLTFKKFRKIHFQKKFKIENGVPVLRRLNWNLVPTKYRLGQQIWIKNSIRLVESFIEKNGKPDLFHVHCAISAGSVAKYINYKYQIPYIITEHSSFFELSDISDAQKEEVVSIYKNAQKVIVVSKPFRKLLCSKLNLEENLVDVVPNFIDTDFFDPNLSVVTKSISKENLIFTVCFHNSNKRLDRLLEAFKIVSETKKNWTLVIGGNGYETNRLKQIVKEYGLEDKVVFTGMLSKYEVRAYMKASKIFVLSSDVETFGVVLIEAMAMGLPVVSTASGGPKDIITSDTGVLVERNAESLANGILFSIDNYYTYNKEIIRQHVIDNFSANKVVERYIAIYTEAIANDVGVYQM